ncbi:hypothetical protein BmIO_00342 [Borrelia miyamotoi]|nr:hypothetical protein [Borrelia miyamotoi]BCR20954.1 hypothetical protein BmIO_00342 [Borrelia miyamotoi]
MSLNYNEINVILKKLSLKNSLIKKIKQPSHKTLIIEFYNKEEENKTNFKILDAYYRRPNSGEITDKIFTTVKKIIENNDADEKKEVKLKDGYNNELSYSKFIENYYDDLEIKETQAHKIKILRKK